MSESIYFAGSVLAAIAITFLFLKAAFKKEVDFLVRPSVLFCMALYALYLLPAVLFHSTLKAMSPFLSQSNFLLSIVLVCTILISRYLHLKCSKVTVVTDLSDLQMTKIKNRLIAALSLLLFIFTCLYFSQVDFRNTGLYAIICEPEHYVILREKSLKLLGIKWLGYVYLIGFSCVSPFLCALFTDKLITEGRKKILVNLAWGIPLLLFILFYLLIPGARVGVLYCSLAVSGVLWYRFKFIKFFLISILTVVGAVSVSALISMSWVNRVDKDEAPSFCVKFDRSMEEVAKLDEATPLEWRTHQSSKFMAYLDGIIFRVFAIPTVISGWYIEEGVQEGMRPNFLYSAEGKVLATTIAQKYVKRLYGEGYIAGKSVAAPTSFIFVNFIYFGFWSIIVSILGILLLDVVFLISKLIKPGLAIPFMGMTLYYTFIFAQTGYFTVLLSHGYFVLGVSLCAVVLISRYLKSNKS